jgi:hypothetical protein
VFTKTGKIYLITVLYRVKVGNTGRMFSTVKASV